MHYLHCESVREEDIEELDNPGLPKTNPLDHNGEGIFIKSLGIFTENDEHDGSMDNKSDIRCSIQINITKNMKNTYI